MMAQRRTTNSFFLLPLTLCLALGCRNCDLVEAELRTRERELREAQAELHRMEAQNQALLRQLGGPHPGPVQVVPELPAPPPGVRQITLGRATGGLDEDNQPGDEALRVVLEPRDGDNHPVKTPGSLHVEVLEVNPEGVKTPLSSWDVSARELGSRWQTGFFSTGYHVVLPWKVWPATERLRVIAQFTLPDGHLFEAEKDVTVRLASPAVRRRPPGDGPELPLPEPNSTLPLSRRVNFGPPSKGGEAPSPAAAVEPEENPTPCWQRPASQPLSEAVRLLRPVPAPVPGRS
jgi:hypothetical protein